jgi:uncharacterized lipoprotein YehR (DUF1307 family)
MKQLFSLLTVGFLMLLSVSMISCTNEDETQTGVETQLSGSITDTKTLDPDKIYTIKMGACWIFPPVPPLRQ